MGVVYYEQGKFTDAEVCLKRALEIDKGILGQENQDVAAILNNLGNVYIDMNRVADAEKCYVDALAIYRKIKDETDPDVIDGFINLASFYSDEKEYDKAEKLYLHVLEIFKKLGAEDDLSNGVCLNNLGTAYMETQRYSDAEIYFKRALEIYKTVLGPNHPNVAACLINLGNLCQQQFRFADAESYMTQSLSAWEETFGTGHPDVASCSNALSQLYRAESNYSQAEAYSKRAYDIARKNFRDGFEVLSETVALQFCKAMHYEADSYLSTLLSFEGMIPGSDRKIAEVVLSTKGQISDGVFIRSRTSSTEADETLKALADSLKTARLNLANLYVQGPDLKHPENHKADLEKASAEKERLESELARNSARYRRELEQWEVDLQKIVSVLPAGSVLVEFMKYVNDANDGESESDYLAVVIKDNSEISVQPLGPASTIDSAVYYYSSHLRLPEMVNDADYAKLSQQVYDLVWKPLAEKVTGSSIVFISTDGLLNLVSFAGLKDESGEYLIKKISVALSCCWP